MQKETFIQQYMAGLNPQQQTAVEAVNGPVLLLAVPGSGKTTVLVTRLGYMVLCCGIAPSEILTMTYTVAATHEMRSRFADRFGADLAKQMAFRTINGLSAVILQYYSRVYGRRQPDLLTNEGDITRMLTGIWQQVNKEFPTESTLKELRTAITYIKNMALTAAEIEAMETDLTNLPELYQRYQAALKAAEQMDYDDQMVFALQILRAAPPVLAYFQQRYRYFCVDESQDTSKIQHEIIRLLAGRSLNLFMVGDEDQSIYGFRAAYPQALMGFEQIYPGARVLLMEENYRSSAEIVAAANAFVARNRYRRPKTLRATQGMQQPIEIRPITRREEQISYLFEQARKGGETAVLFRNNESALPLVDLCERNGVPYRFKKADLTFFTHKIVADVTDFLRFAYEPTNGERFLRIYYKFGLALSRRQALAACGASARSRRPILEELIRDPETKTRMRESLSDIHLTFKRIPQLNAADALDAVRHGCGYGAYLNQKGMDTGRLAILEMLGEQEPTALRLLDRLEELRLLIAAREDDAQTDAALLLSTVHSSKGLEYDRVVLLDVFDGILPAKPEICCRTPEDTRQYEEDRRLFYVAMTRARHKLVLFDCKTMPSAFVQEVIFSLPESQARRARQKAESDRISGRVKPATPKPALPPVDVSAVTRIGAAVQHTVFGRGTVTEFDGRFVTVAFTGKRIKKLDAELVAGKHLLWNI